MVRLIFIFEVAPFTIGVDHFFLSNDTGEASNFKEVRDKSCCWKP